MHQKRTDIDMAVSLLGRLFFSVVDNRDEPIPVLAEVEDHIPVDKVGITDHIPNFGEILPAYHFNDRYPGFDFVRGIRVAIGGRLQMPSSDKVH
jgi:hypothetical protein